MSTKGDAGAGGRVITKVVITYHTEEDPTERTLTMEHGGRGEMVDAVVWNAELMKKVAYLEGERCVVPKKEPGTGEWKVSAAESTASQTESKTSTMETSTAQTSEVQADCIWIHDVDCFWWQYCAK